MGLSNTQKDSGSGPDGKKAKKVYRPPQILYREPIEVIAVVCAPEGIAKEDTGLCPSGPIKS